MFWCWNSPIEVLFPPGELLDRFSPWPEGAPPCKGFSVSFSSWEQPTWAGRESIGPINKGVCVLHPLSRHKSLTPYDSKESLCLLVKEILNSYYSFLTNRFGSSFNKFCLPWISYPCDLLPLICLNLLLVQNAMQYILPSLKFRQKNLLMIPKEFTALGTTGEDSSHHSYVTLSNLFSNNNSWYLASCMKTASFAFLRVSS